MKTLEQIRDEQMVKCVGIVALIIAFISYFVGEPNSWWNPGIILTGFVFYAMWTIWPKAFVFTIWQSTLFGLVGYFVFNFYFPLFKDEWSLEIWNLVVSMNWLKYTIGYLSIAILAFLGSLSITSCWDSKKLTPKQVGQLVILGHMPDWGKNMRNNISSGGLFLGLPSGLVSITALDGTEPTINDKITIQVKIDGDPQGKEFSAVFDDTYVQKIVDTKRYIIANTDKSILGKFREKGLTAWLNDDANNYKTIEDLRSDIGDMQDYVSGWLSTTDTEYGVEMKNYRIIDVQKTDKEIEQQIKNAANLAAQEAADIQEQRDIEALERQIDYVMEKNPGMLREAAANRVHTQRGMRQKIDIKGGGIPVIDTSPRKKKKNP